MSILSPPTLHPTNLIQAHLTEQVYSLLFIWCFVPVCGFIAFFPNNEGPRNHDLSLHLSQSAQCWWQSLLHRITGIPTRERDKFSTIRDLVWAPLETLQGLSPTVQLKDFFIRLLLTLIISINRRFCSDSLVPWVVWATWVTALDQTFWFSGGNDFCRKVFQHVWPSWRRSLNRRLLQLELWHLTEVRDPVIYVALALI